jgi:tagatose 6-phosphate kinase
VLVCLGPNPAVDRTALVEALEPNEILRPIEVVVLPGGKALCAARAARALGVPVGVGLIVGGHAGRWLVEASEREGLGPLAVESGVETRTTYVVVDRRARQIAVYEPSAAVSPAVFETFLGLVASRLLPKATWVIAAGSLPTGIAPDGYAAIVEECRRAGRPCLVDTSGDALRAAVAARPTVVKVSLPEAQAAGFGGLARDAAGAIAAAGAEVAVVTDGARGAVATDGRRLWRVVPPRIRALCAVGSGDAFAAGFVVALSRGKAVDEALAHGAAAGAANALTLGAGRLSLADHEAQLGRVRVTELPSWRTVAGSPPRGARSEYRGG